MRYFTRQYKPPKKEGFREYCVKHYVRSASIDDSLKKSRLEARSAIICRKTRQYIRNEKNNDGRMVHTR